MLKHVVCHKYKSAEEAQKIAPMLGSLLGRVEALRSMQTGINVLQSGRAYHLVLIAEFDDEAGLRAYQEHPEHLKVREYIHSVLESSVSVDFEC